MDKVIEAMAERVLAYYTRFASDSIREAAYDIAKAMLSLCHPCRECEGKGYTTKHDSRGLKSACFDCQSTGLGKKMIGILAENQEPPENPYDREIDIFDNIRLATKQGYNQAQQDMLKTDTDGYAFRRVKVEEDNDG